MVHLDSDEISCLVMVKVARGYDVLPIVAI